MKKFFALALVLILLAGCQEGPVTPEKRENKEPKEVKTLRFSVAQDVESIDAQRASSVPSFTLLNHILEGLVREENGKIKPGIAKYWEVSADKTVYRFYLRKALWQDNQPILAQEFRDGFRRLVDPEIASDYAFIAFPIKNAQKVYEGELPKEDLGVVALGPDVLEITLEQPTKYFLMSLGTMPHFAPIRKDYMETYGQDYAKDEQKLAYNGPFILKEWAQGEKMTLQKNEHYWDKENIHLDEVDIFVVMRSEDRLYLFENKEIDFVDVPPLMADSYINEAEFYYSGGNDFLLFNQKNERLRHLSLRKAINYAIHRTEFIDITTKGRYEPSGRLVLPVLSGFLKTYGEEYPLSFYPWAGHMEKAQAFLKQALQEMGLQDPQDISLRLLAAKGEKEEAEVLQEMLTENLGIQITLEVELYQERLLKESQGAYDMVYTGWTPDYDDPMSYLEIFVSDSPYNHGAYHSEAFDALVAKAKIETDDKKRYDLLFEAEKVIMEDAAIAPLQFRKMAWLKNPKLVGVYKNFYGTRENFVHGDFVE